MTVKEIIEKNRLKVLNPEVNLEGTVTGGYVSDLLSDVMGYAAEGEIWITLQSHMNVVAIASLKDLAAILLVKNTAVGTEVLTKATAEGIPVLSTGDSTFEASGKIFELLNRK